MSEAAAATKILGLFDPALVLRAGLTLAVVLFFLVVRPLLSRLVGRRVGDTMRRYVARKAISYGAGILSILALSWVWLGGITGIATYLGIVSAGLAIALQDPLENLAGWFFVVIRKPFTTGDRIRIGEHVGDVIDITLFQTSIMEVGGGDAGQSTGRIVHIPNGWVFKHSVRNDTQGFDFIWAEISVTVTFESDWRRAKEILLGIAASETPVSAEQAEVQMRKAAQRLAISYGYLTPVVWTTVEASGVSLIVRYPCPPRERRIVASRIWERVLAAFASEDGIDFAYPTWRMFDNGIEGKGAKPAHRPDGQLPRPKPTRRPASR